jgi:L-alanine-DL-glutamate epimerase-like enolase superfamily enzyme
VMRAISCIDIALWDIKGKATGRPVYKLLGAFRDEVPAYASGGYYFPGKDPDGLAAEMRDYVERGFRAVKMKIGRLDPEGEAERVRAVREAVGPSVKIMVDANNAWDSLPEALETIRAIAPYNIYWLEEPTLPDAMALSARIAEVSEIPVATGEIESTLWAFENLIHYRAADILQPDVTVVGGITEFMRVAELAAAHGLPIAPHYFWDIHAHLAAACPNALFVEYFVHDDVVNFDLVLKAPVEAQGGRLALPAAPGLGIELDEAKVAQYRLG